MVKFKRKSKPKVGRELAHEMSGDEQEALVEHTNNDRIHKRKVTFEGGVGSLIRGILRAYDDILVAKIAAETGMSDVEVRDVANHDQIAMSLHLSTYDDKYAVNIDLVEGVHIPRDARIVVEVIGNKSKERSKNKSAVIHKNGNDDDDNYDITLQIKDLKLHIRVSDSEKPFKPFWCNYVTETKPAGILPAGTYQIWCPVYAGGQGYISIGSEANSETFYEVTVSGMATISGNSTSSTEVCFESSPEPYDESVRIKFKHNEAYLGYHSETGKVSAKFFAKKTPKNSADFQIDFQVMALQKDYKMYYQIFDKDGERAKGQKSGFLHTTDKNMLARFVHQVDTDFKDPSSLFALYRVTDTCEHDL